MQQHMKELVPLIDPHWSKFGVLLLDYWWTPSDLKWNSPKVVFFQFDMDSQK